MLRPTETAGKYARRTSEMKVYIWSVGKGWDAANILLPQFVAPKLPVQWKLVYG